MRNIISFMLIFSGVVFTQELPKHPIDVFVSECMEKDNSTHGTIKCLNEGAEKWDAELNKAYNDLKGLLDEEGKKKLKESQLEWIKFRDKEFLFIDKLYSTLDGTMYLQMRAADRLEIIRKRALELQSYIDILKI